MAYVSGGHLVARALKAEGIHTLFTLSGEHVAEIYDGCLTQGIRVIDTRHEQAAAHAAEAYARLTRGPGVAVVTAGPGVTDAVTGVANAFSGNVPVVLIGGASAIIMSGKGALQEMEQVDMFRSITRWCAKVPRAEQIPEYLATAFRKAMAPPRGPVFLEIPYDVLIENVDDEQARALEGGGYRTHGRVPGDPHALEQAAALLRASERPVLMGGNAVWWDDAADALRAFTDATGVPVLFNGMGRGCLPESHPHFYKGARSEALRSADLVISVGAPFDFRLGYGRAPTFHDDAKFVQIDLDAGEIGRNRKIDVPIVADARSALTALTALYGKPAVDRAAWHARLRPSEEKRRKQIAEWAAMRRDKVTHYTFAWELTHAIDDETIVICDGGNIVAATARVLGRSVPGRWLDPGPLGCLGVGAPYALAAKALHPDKRVVVIFGDGSFGLNGFDMETAVRHRLPIVGVIGNDAAWGQIREPQVMRYGEDREIATRLEYTRYDQVMTALGGHGELVERAEDMRPALERAFASGKPAVVNVLLYRESLREQGGGSYAI